MNNYNDYERGITLIALIITIIVMLILVAITIYLLINSELFNYAGKATSETAKELQNEKNFADLNLDRYLYSWGTEQREMTVSNTKDETNNAWCTTVTINVALDNPPTYTLEQKKTIAAFLLDMPDYSSIESLKSSYASEEDFVDDIIESWEKYMDYSDINKLEEMGIKVIEVITPYGNTLYTSNLGGSVKCTLDKNGKHKFKIISGGTQKVETVTVNNIRTAAKHAPYSVRIENESEEFQYSADDTNNWQDLEKGETIVTCSNNIKIKFKELPPNSGIAGRSLHYVEKNSEYYMFFNDEEPLEWSQALRHHYSANGYLLSRLIVYVFLPYRIPEGDSLKLGTQRILLSNTPIEALLTNSIDVSHLTPRIYNFCEEMYDKYHDVDTNNYYNINILDAKIEGNNFDYPADMVSKYPEFSIGNDSALVWKNGDGLTESPVLTLNVTKDMSVLMSNDAWD